MASRDEESNARRSCGSSRWRRPLFADAAAVYERGVDPSSSGAPTATAPAHARVSWDEYFMNIAREVATRSTCPRKFVGAVIVRDRTILSTGYNGSIRGMPHCDEIGHMMEDGHCVRTIHAEMNAIIQAAKNGTAISGAAIYVTASPCWNCFKAIANAGIVRIVFGEFYRDERIFEVAQAIGIDLVDLSGTAGAPR
jgi:dCMP deaminase